MPVASLSRCWIACSTSLPCRAMRRKSSSSAFTPSAITPPFCIWLFAGSGYISCAKRLYTFDSGSIFSAILCNTGESVDSSAAFNNSTEASEFFSCTNSRGVTRIDATREAIRSRSPIDLTCSLTVSANSLSSTNALTTS